MIQLKIMLNCTDNSGTAIVECVQVLKMKRHAKVGDRIVVVQKQRSLAAELSGAAATAQKYGRADGSFVRFDDNARVLINKAGDPMGTRLNGIVAELRGKKWSKILFLAPIHV